MTTGILLLLLSFFLHFPNSHQAAATEADALLQWKSTLINPAALSSWSPANSSSICRWRGVSCNSAGELTALSLPDSGLNGTLDDLNFAALPSLAQLNLNSNLLSGSIPAGISALSNLTSLDLSGNSFVSISPAIGNLSELLDLSLYNNNLAGSIPYQLSHLPKVRHVDLGSNYFNNPDYARFQAMPSLLNLSLGLNYLDQGFPGFILNCTNLIYLDLSQNNFSGPIPDSIGTKLVNLQHLILTMNSFQGKIPVSLANLAGLRELRLGSNFLTGEYRRSSAAYQISRSSSSTTIPSAARSLHLSAGLESSSTLP
ncbi:putative LRR receptor-like serine/threonine-protein kinase [Platanthera zijinensis]|uniref:LRR receptor-like serine/threonine-protein kinase n=1 Tax=Platanthera zijinensis TaxID=2320716 RepID=A0AAP0BJU5_9ASPA